MAPAPAAAAAVVPPAAPAAWQGAAIEAEPGPMPGVGFAPHAGRLIAYIIDAFIIGVVVTVVAIILTPAPRRRRQLREHRRVGRARCSCTCSSCCSSR